MCWPPTWPIASTPSSWTNCRTIASSRRSRKPGGPSFVSTHADPEHLRTLLGMHLGPGQRPLVATDGVFAARGRIAPLDAYVDVLNRYSGAVLLVDDAHALGVLGANGRGTLEHFAIYDGINDGGAKLVCGTLSKAVGGYGGIVPGTQSLIERLKRTSHWYDGASPLPRSNRRSNGSRTGAAAGRSGLAQLASEERPAAERRIAADGARGR